MARLLVPLSLLLTGIASQPAFAQQIGNVEKAMADTLCASLMRRGELGPNCSDVSGKATWAATKARYNAAMAGLVSGSCFTQNAIPYSFGGLIRCRYDQLGLPLPLQLGAAGFNALKEFYQPGYGGYDGGGFGGGGASGTWDAKKATNCANVSHRLDAALNIVIPSAPLRSGGNLAMNQSIFEYGSHPGGYAQIHADTREALAKRSAHLRNLSRGKPDWFGVVGPNAQGNVVLATVAYRNVNGTLIPREEIVIGAVPTGTRPAIESHNGFEDKPCPASDVTGGTFTFYGYNAATAQFPNGWGGHMHGCTMYVPNYQLSKSGYAINDETSVTWAANNANWPASLPAHVRDCPIDPALIRRLTDGIYTQAANAPGYDGAPHDPIQDQGVRPGTTSVGDLGETADPIGNGDSTANPPTVPPTPTPTGTTVNVDFGPNPGNGAPTLEEPPTGTMDPIFNWLPDLPSITLDTNNTECPVWSINLTEYGGPQWQFLVDKHCDLFEANRAAIRALMVVIFSLSAGFIILRA